MQPSSSVAADPSAPGGRVNDPFLELLRNVSVLRVVLLHLVLRPPLVYFPWIQWIYPGMPEIFFVSGWLAGISIAKRSPWSVTASRLRRVLIPYAVYAVGALLAMFVTDRRTTVATATLRWGDLGSFVFPLVTPRGSDTRVVLWSHLWFVTVFVWMVLATPPLLWIARRFERSWLTYTLTICVPTGVLLAALVDRASTKTLSPQVGLIGQFGIYYTMGLAGQQVRVRFARQSSQVFAAALQKPMVWALVAAVSASGGVFVATVVEPISSLRPRELYSSRLAYSLVGLAWLALALALHGPLSNFMTRHPNKWLRACTQRTFTLYLWGLPADAIGVAAAKPWTANRWVAVPVYFSVSLLALSVAVIAFGWVEDISAKRSPRVFPELA